MEYWWAQTENGQPVYQHLYTPTGFQDILNPVTSMEYLKKTAERFGHVRFLLDPLVAGKVENGVYVYPDANNISPNMQAFIDDVNLCNDAGLPVVINLFPYWISQRHFDYIVKGVASSAPPFTISQPNGVPSSTNNAAWEIATGNIPNRFTSPRQYPGPWRKDFAFQFVDGPIANDHPLVKSWREIAKMFADYNPGQVYYQMMSEAQVGMTDRNFFTTTEYNKLIPPLEPTGTIITARASRWREIQLAAIKEIQKADKDARIIASSSESFPFSFVKPSNSVNAVGGYESAFKKYTPAEVSDADKIIYAFHMYAPFRFTHPSGLDWQDPKWRYHNKSVIDTSDLFGTPIENYQVLAPETGTAPNSIRNDFSAVIGTFSPHQTPLSEYHATRLKQQLDLMELWRNIEWPGAGSVNTTLGNPPVTTVVPNSNPIMMTEYGAEKSSVGRAWDSPFHEREIDGFVWNGPEGIIPLAVNNERELMRARWIYDVRKLAEHQQYGWSFFAGHGSFGAFKGQLFKSSWPYEQHEVQPVEFLNTQFEQALMSNTRPMP